MDTVWGDTVISESALTKAVARLRKALGDDSATHRYLETVRSRGYRFVADVEGIESPNQPDLSPRKGRATIVRRGLMASAVAILALVLVAVFWPGTPQRETPEAGVIRSLAVLPLNNLTGDPEQDYYVDGLQDILITELSRIRDLRVTSRQSTIRYRNSELPTTDIAGELGVDAIVEGSLLREGNRIELTVQLLDGRSDEHLWSEWYARETPDIFNLISDVASATPAPSTPMRSALHISTGLPGTEYAPPSASSRRRSRSSRSSRLPGANWRRRMQCTPYLVLPIHVTPLKSGSPLR